MRAPRYTPRQWKRICELTSLLLDTPSSEWSTILERECGDDCGLRTNVIEVCQNYSETSELFGVEPQSPLLLEDSLVGRRIGSWQILRLLGEGGMGRVYLVERADGVFAQYAALKLNREYSGAESVRRFHAERRILAMLEHPSIARAIDGGATPGGAPYLVMEYVDGGRPIDEFLQCRPLREKIRLFLQVVEAVEAAHRQQIAHRDLKPSNILVTPDGRPKILDFGIAKLFESGSSSGAEHTVGASAALTPAYASPEQLLQEPSSQLSDIYSLGAVLYKILTGRPPHELTEHNILQAARLVAESDPDAPSAHARDVDADVDAIVLKALDRNPARRYASATEFGADLGRFLEGSAVQARDGAFWYRVHRRIRRHRGVAVAAGVGLLLTMAAGGWALRARQVERQRLEHVRQTAQGVIADYRSQLTKLTGSTVLRNKIATAEKQYLDSIYPDAIKDPQMWREVASAYGLVSGHQSESKAAQDSMHKSLSLWRQIRDHRGEMTQADRVAMAGAARRLGWSQIQMGQLNEAGASLDEGVQILDYLPAHSRQDQAVRSERVRLYYQMSRLGVWEGNGPKAISYARKAVAEHEKLPFDPTDRSGLPMTRLQFADAADTHGRGDKQLLAEALEQTRLAVQSVRQASAGCQERSCREVKAAVLTRASIIFMHQELFDEALSLRDGVDLAESLLAEDPGNTGAVASLRFGLYHMGWTLSHLGRLEESLRMRRRLLEVSVVFASNPGSDEARVNEAVACTEVGRNLVNLKRLHEAQGFFERSAEILANPPATKSVQWYLRQTDVYQDLGQLHETLGRHAAARTEFAKQSKAAEIYLSKTGSALAKEVEAVAHSLYGKSMLAVDKPAGCLLLRKSLDRFAELKKAATGGPSAYLDEQSGLARKASQGCGI
jgi:eukaryotic-like serine/threonine-protein kinase